MEEGVDVGFFLSHLLWQRTLPPVLPNMHYLASDGIFGVINAASSNPKQGVWGLIKWKYLFLVQQLHRIYDIMYGLGIYLFGWGFFKPQTVFVFKALYQALQVTLNWGCLLLQWGNPATGSFIYDTAF